MSQPPPSERYTCIRCGAARRSNAGRKRKARSTGMCKDCFISTEWECPICLRVFSLSVKGAHLQRSHNLLPGLE